MSERPYRRIAIPLLVLPFSANLVFLTVGYVGMSSDRVGLSWEGKHIATKLGWIHLNIYRRYQYTLSYGFRDMYSSVISPKVRPERGCQLLHVPVPSVYCMSIHCGQQCSGVQGPLVQYTLSTADFLTCVVISKVVISSLSSSARVWVVSWVNIL